MVLLIRGGQLEQKKVVAAVRPTFLRRATHKVSPKLDSPPAEWASVFDALAKECGLAMKIEEGFEAVREFTGQSKM